MSRKLKELIEAELKTHYGEQREAVLVNVVGLSGIEANNLRRAMRQRKLDMHVVPNRLFRRVVAGSVLAPLAGAMQGPCAIVTGAGSAIETAKELMKLVTDFPKLELKVGLAEGLDTPMPVDGLSKLRGRMELVGDVVMLTISPGRRLAGAVAGPGRRVAGCVKAIVEKLEKGETIARVA